MVDVEIHGFDESGNIGQNLLFVRACLNERNILRPFIYNLLHFNCLSLHKDRLKGQSEIRKKDYLRMLLEDPALDIEFYVFPVETQLHALRKFTASEFQKIYYCRKLLIDAINIQIKPDDTIEKINEIKPNISSVLSSLKHFMKPDRYIEIFIKAYGHKQLISSLEESSKMLQTRQRDCRIISIVDGGYPFVFWAEDFLRQSTLDGNCFSQFNTPILGMTAGDEYFPPTNIAGNIACIANNIPGLIYPHTLKKLSPMPDNQLDTFHNQYRKGIEMKKSLSKILFVGQIPSDLRYSIPTILYLRNQNRNIFEPFCINYSLESFKKEFGLRNKDTIVMGNIQSGTKYEEMIADAHEMKVPLMCASDMVDPFDELVCDVIQEAKSSTLNSIQCKNIEDRLSKIQKDVKKQLI